MKKRVTVKFEPYLAARISKVAAIKKISFNDACVFLISKVLTPKAS